MNVLKITAFEYATEKHAGQTRSDGSEYIAHPCRVADTIMDYAPDNFTIFNAALLHDTLEDTDATYDEILELFGKSVADLVLELTSDPLEIKRIGKTEYLIAKMCNMSDDALTVKLADRLDNVQDLKTAKSEAWRAKYKKSSLEIMTALVAHRSISPFQSQLITEILTLIK